MKRTYIGEGASALIYLENNEATKVYFDEVLENDRLSIDMFNYIKNLNHDYLLKLHKYELTKLNELVIKSYTYDYLEKIKPKYISNIEEYLLNSFNEIEKLARYLADERIRMMDLYETNTIYTNDKIVLIDPDLYKFDKNLDKEYILRNNESEIRGLFNRILQDFYKLSKEDKNAIYENVNYKTITSDYEKIIQTRRLVRKK